MSKKIKVKPFNELPLEERKRIIFYMEDYRRRGMQQVVELLKDDIGKNQKAKVRRWIHHITCFLEEEYEEEKN